MPVDHVSVKLVAAVASNTGQAYIGAWDSYVVAEPGTLFAATAVAQSLTSSGRVNTVDIFLQPSGVSGASNSATSVLTAPIALASNNNAASGAIRASNQRVAVGDILQLKTDSGAAGSLAFGNLSATVLIKPD
jgi:hypothetical protein